MSAVVSEGTAASAPQVERASPMLRVDKVRKGFAASTRSLRSADFKTVLADVSFEVQPGEVVSLLGASGCGKTTLLRIVAGLIRADAGSVAVQGRRVTAPRKDLAMVFQQPGLLPWRSVLSNVSFPLEIDHAGRAEREAVAAHYLEIVGLTGYTQHLPHELSGGMQQRVGIARALVRKPLLLLMDEPFGALDAQTRETLQDDFVRIWKQLQTTVVFVTHSIDEALLLSDRVVVLASPGRIKQIVTPSFASERGARDVRSHPAFAECAQAIRDLLRTERTL